MIFFRVLRVLLRDIRVLRHIRMFFFFFFKGSFLGLGSKIWKCF